MTSNFFKSIAAASLLGLGAMANAASVSLVATTPTDNVMEGVTVSFDVVLDFTDEPTLGGGFDVIFDETQLGFLSLENGNLGDPAFYRDPDISPGLLSSWAVGDFNGLTGGTVGSVSFEVLPGATATTVALGATSGIAGPWVSAATFQVLDPQPDYNAIDVTVAPVPLPAAAWLFGSALLGLAGVTRRRKQA